MEKVKRLFTYLHKTLEFEKKSIVVMWIEHIKHINMMKTNKHLWKKQIYPKVQKQPNIHYCLSCERICNLFSIDSFNPCNSSYELICWVIGTVGIAKVICSFCNNLFIFSVKSFAFFSVFTLYEWRQNSCLTFFNCACFSFNSITFDFSTPFSFFSYSINLVCYLYSY